MRLDDQSVGRNIVGCGSDARSEWFLREPIRILWEMRVAKREPIVPRRSPQSLALQAACICSSFPASSSVPFQSSSSNPNRIFNSRYAAIQCRHDERREWFGQHAAEHRDRHRACHVRTAPGRDQHGNQCCQRRHGRHHAGPNAFQTGFVNRVADVFERLEILRLCIS